jgi:type I site-specific restriction endonuclease
MPLEDAPAGTRLQQVNKYAEILGLKFAYATNGGEILEFDYTTAQERHLSAPGKTFSALQTAHQSASIARGCDIYTPKSVR